MTRMRVGERSSIPGRLTLLFGFCLLVGCAAAALTSYLGGSPLVVFLVGIALGLSAIALSLSTALAPSLALLEALSDGVDGWRNGDFSLVQRVHDKIDLFRGEDQWR